MTTDRTHLTNRDVGKTLIDSDGERVGVIAGVQGDHVEVDPDTDRSTFDHIKTRFGWKDRDQDTFTIDTTAVAAISDDAVQLREE